MSTVATDSVLQPTADERALRIAAYVGMLRGAINSIPLADRVEVFEQVADLAPAKPPQRGKAVLENVVELFKQKTEWSAAEALKALAAGGEPPDAKKVYSALTYLKDMKLLRRVGYGRYMVEGGGLITTHDVEGP